MARISVVRDGVTYRITLKGRLAADDLGRLERACGNALEQQFAPLELDVEHVFSIDDAARGFLDRLSARGARIHGSLDMPHLGRRR